MQFKINKKHKHSIIEECTRRTVEADNMEEAIEILKTQGAIITDTNEIFNIITIEG